MKGFLLAAISSLAYAAIVLLWFRRSPPVHRARLMMRVYLALLPALLVCFAITPANLGLLPADMVEANAWLDAGFALFAFSASVIGGWLQLYNLAERGLSLRILIDAAERPDGALSALLVHSSYGQGKGIRWMYGKRLGDLQRLRLIHSADDFYALTEKGWRSARLILHLRRLYAIPTPPGNKG
jgi:hypothetical protein